MNPDQITQGLQDYRSDYWKITGLSWDYFEITRLFWDYSKITRLLWDYQITWRLRDYFWDYWDYGKITGITLGLPINMYEIFLSYLPLGQLHEYNILLKFIGWIA